MLKLYISPWGLLLWSITFFVTSNEEFISLISAVCVHEFGHVVALKFIGSKVELIKITVSGFQIDYDKFLSPIEEIITALAGPVFGFIWFFIARQAGLELSAWLSFALSVFNLLPVSILDGGRVLNGIMRILSVKNIFDISDRIICTILLIFGIYLTITGFGMALLNVSALLIIYTLVKNTKMV